MDRCYENNFQYLLQLFFEKGNDLSWTSNINNRISVHKIGICGGMNSDVDSKEAVASYSINLTENEIRAILENWRRDLDINWGWIEEFNKLIVRYTKFLKQLKIIGKDLGNVTSVKFSIDGSRLVTSSGDKTVRIWDMSTKSEIQKFRGHSSRVLQAQFSADGFSMASCSWDKTIRIWDLVSGDVRKLTGHLNPVTAIQFSLDNKNILSSSYDTTVRLWDVKLGLETNRSQRHSYPVMDVKIPSNGQSILICLHTNIELWNGQLNEQIQQFVGHSNSVLGAEFSPDEKTILSYSADKTIRIWDIKSGKELNKLEGHTGWVVSAKFSPDSDIIASGSTDKTIRLWDAKSGDEIIKLEGHTRRITGLDFSPDGRTIISSSSDGTIRLWG
ncbi:WD-40 repeat protein [Reticulomyxa filosa]|nr:WD-40 repeat protein [Reticulomyxa filosa]|eukprot:ETO01889.1 WD-40 repeat protein [Reticulomyxa filosa]